VNSETHDNQRNSDVNVVKRKDTDENERTQAADEAWAREMTAQRAAKKAEAQADLSGLADDIKVATDLAGSAMSERKDRRRQSKRQEQSKLKSRGFNPPSSPYHTVP